MPKVKKIEFSQEFLEDKILEYQDALKKERYQKANDLYDKICKIYQPQKYIGIWGKKYSYLYDSYEDFVQDYMKIFISTIKKWKPKEERKKSRYNGEGTFKNYFWGSLAHSFINIVKAQEGASKRNITSRCPECEEWVSPLSTHIIKHHADILWEKLLKDGINVKEIRICPFCTNSIYKGKSATSENELVQKHILSKHLYLLFDAFSDKHLSFSAASLKIASANTFVEHEGESCNIYDITVSPMSVIDRLVSSGLSGTQQLILDNILSKKNPKIKYSKNLYKCSEDEFNEALEDIQDRVLLMEDSSGKFR